MNKSIDRQEHQDAAYAHAYRAWVSSLPAPERATLAALDLAEPDTKHRTANSDPELALTLATANPWDRDDCEADADVSTPRRTDKDVALALASFCARVRSHSNPLLAFDTLCFATGLMGLEGRSQTALAAQHGVTKAAFSKQVVGWLDIFELTPPRGCRSSRVRETMRNVKRAAKVATPKSPLPGSQSRNRYPTRSADPTVVFVRGLDLFRRWFRTRCRKLPLRRWSPDAREILRVELAWFARIHAELTESASSRID